MLTSYNLKFLHFSHFPIMFSVSELFSINFVETTPRKSGNSERKGSKESVGRTSKENVAVVPSPSKNSKDSKAKDELQLWMKIYIIFGFLNADF